jgi:hypothetical protein
MEMVRKIAEEVKFFSIITEYFVLVVEWHYEHRQLIKRQLFFYTNVVNRSDFFHFILQLQYPSASLGYSVTPPFYFVYYQAIFLQNSQVFFQLTKR